MQSANQSARNDSEEESEMRRGPWTLEEDTILIHCIACHGEGRWNLLAKFAGLKRTGKSCRLRWLNYLKPDIKRGNLTPQEQILILELHSRWGNRWSKIAQHLPGRTDNEIKNYWRTRVQKQARHLKIESNSKRFLEAIRCFWMPRLVEQMEQTSSLSLSSSPIPPTMGTQNSTISSVPPGEMKCVNQANEKPEICFSDSMGITEMPGISEQATSPGHGFTSLVDECYYVDIIRGYDMEGFNLDPMSAMGPGEFSDSQVAGSDLISDDMAGALWNMGELWQFRKP